MSAGKPHREAALIALLHVDVLRRAIGSQDNGFASALQLIEGVEELLLDTLFALEELDIVDQKNVCRAVLLLETIDLLRADRVHEVVRELLRSDEDDLLVREVLSDVVADSLKKVGLTEPGSSPEEQRVVLETGLLGNCKSRVPSKAVRLTDDEEVEGVLGIELGQRGTALGSRARQSRVPAIR